MLRWRGLDGSGALPVTELHQEREWEIKDDVTQEELQLPHHIVSELPALAIPGYSGHKPGVYAGNVCGHVHSFANMRGITHAGTHREVHGIPAPRRQRARSLSMATTAPLTGRNANLDLNPKIKRVYGGWIQVPSNTESMGNAHVMPASQKTPGSAYGRARSARSAPGSSTLMSAASRNLAAATWVATPETYAEYHV
mmetsp:Transcript_70957/g.140848  ORF Transcript_70957/g.140848 Transcript_70957/m.140848 type:complete len:197 (-) Transcript_70957:52-642(-)